MKIKLVALLVFILPLVARADEASEVVINTVNRELAGSGILAEGVSFGADENTPPRYGVARNFSVKLSDGEGCSGTVTWMVPSSYIEIIGGTTPDVCKSYYQVEGYCPTQSLFLSDKESTSALYSQCR